MPNYPTIYSEATGGRVIPTTGHMYPRLPNIQPTIQVVNQESIHDIDSIPATAKFWPPLSPLSPLSLPPLSPLPKPENHQHRMRDKMLVLATPGQDNVLARRAIVCCLWCYIASCCPCILYSLCTDCAKWAFVHW